MVNANVQLNFKENIVLRKSQLYHLPVPVHAHMAATAMGSVKMENAFATLSFLETIAQSRNVRIIAMPMDHVKMEHVYVINNIMVNSVKKHFVLIIVMAMELATPKLDVAIARKVLAVSAARKAICAQTSAATMVIVL
jgi:hypothetical protein